MKQAGAIIRVSTARQLSEGTSPEKQAEAIAVLAAEQGYELDHSRAWVLAESGKLRERLGFHKALDAAHAGEIERVYVFSIDRLGRDLLEMLLFLRELGDAGIECWEADRRRRLDGDDLLVQVEAAFAGKERRLIIERTQDGLRRAIAAGRYSGGVIAYGYHLNPDTKRLEIDEVEASVVRLIFEWTCEEGLNTIQIAERLNALSVPTRGTKLEAARRERGKASRGKPAGIWRPNSVRNMLLNPTYAGSWEWGKRSKKRAPTERIAASCPPIVSVETLAIAARALANNRWPVRSSATRQYLLRGIIRCANCGHAYCGSASHVATGEKRYYRCNLAMQWRKLGQPKCPGKSLVADTIEDLVWADVLAFIKAPEVAIAQLRAQRAPVDATLGERLAEVEHQLEELARRERNLLRAAAEAPQLDVVALNDVVREIRSGEASLQAYRASLATRLQAGEALDEELFGVASRLAHLQGRIDQAAFEERRRALRQLVKGIEVRTKVVDGQRIPHVVITYAFQDLGLPDVSPFQLFTYGADSTSSRAGSRCRGRRSSASRTSDRRALPC